MLSLLGRHPLYGAKGQSPLFSHFLNVPGLIHCIITNRNQHQQIPKVNSFAGLLYLFFRIFPLSHHHISLKIFIFTAFTWFIIFSSCNLSLHHFHGRLFSWFLRSSCGRFCQSPRCWLNLDHLCHFFFLLNFLLQDG